MKKFSLLIFAFALVVSGYGQLTSPGATIVQTTVYTNGAVNDPIFIFCNPNAAGQVVSPSLTATPTGGVAGWTFAWFTYNAGTNSWNPLSVDINVPTSTISGLTTGGYRVVITDGNGNNVGCFRAWVWNKQNTVTINPVAAGCSAFDLTGSLITDDYLSYYNPPADPFIIGPTTTVSVCFTAPHTYVSDLGFYLVGPPSCGSPTIPLAPHPEFINSANGCCCNSGDNVNNLCFSTNNTNLLTVCGAPTPLTGTYGIYGQGTPNNFNTNNNNWSPIFGCDATQGGWRVQIYDCIGADVGTLTNATITFTGNSVCGPSSITYNSGNISSAINDNSCTPQSASIYTVPSPPNFPVANILSTTTYEWSSNPAVAFPIPTGGSAVLPQNINPQQDTWFYLTATNSFGCVTVDSIFYDYIPPVPPVISALPTPICSNGIPFALSADVAGGTWSGPGIIDPANGIFNPQVAGPGSHQITYTTPPPCGAPSTVTINVSPAPNVNFTFTDSVCSLTTLLNAGVSTVAPPGVIAGYAWDINGDLQPDFTGILPTQSVTFPTQGTYPITLLVTTAQGCFDTITKPVTVLENPTASFTAQPTSNCGEPFTFNGSASQPAGTLTYGWDFTSNGSVDQSGTSATTTHQFAGPGTYTVSLITTGLGNCRDTAQVSVTVHPRPNVSYTGPATFCGTIVPMASEGQVTAPSTMDQYTWFYNGQPVGTGQNVLQSFSVSPSTTVTGFVVGTTSNGCADTATFSIDLKPNPISGFTFNDNCIGLSIPFTNDLQWNGTPGSGTTVNYSWNFGDGQTSTQENPTNNYASAGIYNVSLISTSSEGCADTVTIPVTASPLPQASFEAIPQCLQNVVFVSTSNGNGTPLTGWNWNLGDGNSAADSTFTYEYANAGTFNVTLIVSNAQGCTDTAIAQVNVVASVPLTSLDIPNILTPNGDNVNDEIDIDQLVTECDEYEILIFNRWGLRVFRQEKGSEPFKGYQQGGGRLTAGVYFYTFRSGELEKNGTITIAY